MNGMRAGDRILHVMVQASHSGHPQASLMARQPSGSLDAAGSGNMAAAAAVLAAAANGQQHMLQAPPQADWQLLQPPAGGSGGMMW